MGQFVTLKKSGPKYGPEKAGHKKQGHCYLHPAFCNPYFGPDFFQGRKQTHVFKTRIVGAD